MSSTSRPNYGWLQGKTVRKSGTAVSSSHATRTSTPQVQSTSSTIYGGGVKDPSGRTAEYFASSKIHSMDDQCPAFDRLFTLGPAPCPICQKVLRKLAFSPQTFEDLDVEKEVAVRRRLAKEFNKRREDFDDLRSYNDYLEEVEDIGKSCFRRASPVTQPFQAFNLINNIDVQETEARIATYKAANAALIALNIQREEAYALALKEQEELDRKEREARAAQLAQEEQLEREEKVREQREIIDKLETSQKDAREVVAKSRANAAKRLAAVTGNNTGLAGMGFGFGADYAKLLKTRTTKKGAALVPDEPHVPLKDDWYAYEDLYVLKEGGYDDVVSEAVRKDREGIMRAGGYMVQEAWHRALRSAVAGLDLSPLEGLEEPVEQPEIQVDAGGDVVMAAA
ncbi:TFIIH/NER complex subunit [Paramarasmius palmivorus]|uniref:TFIIH/NER complex subunit n=1 Tax=Paramarasmius palmivorus TaxID=297713 RepID=A0AAW0DFQ8_9AGAR